MIVYVKSLKGESYKIDVGSDDTLKTLKKLVAKKVGDSIDENT